MSLLIFTVFLPKNGRMQLQKTIQVQMLLLDFH